MPKLFTHIKKIKERTPIKLLCFNRIEYRLLNGKLHRKDGPAIEFTNGDKWWYQNGILHREGGPAVEYANGYKAWYQNGIIKTNL